MGDVGELIAPPYRLDDNVDSLLAVSDLVFIDPVSTGYSRAVEGGSPKEYHGYTADIESVGELIRLWTTRHNRWMSPKFLAGESYGTLRAAALAEHLQSRHGLYLNGVMLISSVLDLGSIDFTSRNDRGYAQLPADVCRRGPLPRQARPQESQDRARRGGGVCRARLPVGPRPREPAHGRRARRRCDDRWPG